MALPPISYRLIPVFHFLVSAGSILFASTHAPLRVYLIYHQARGEWLLPKGRKDRESVIVAAARETFEETGYPCELLQIDLVTRPSAAGGSEEPFMDTLRRTKEDGVQILSWFATVCTAGVDKVVGAQGLQTEVEDYESAFFEVDETMRVAVFQVDWDVIGRAVELVRGRTRGLTRLSSKRWDYQPPISLPPSYLPIILSHCSNST